VTEIVVRQATLADAHAITDIYCSNVKGGVFTRRNPDGTRTPTPYETLSIFERYLHGGAWMSVEMCAVWLAHLLRYGDEIPLVVQANGIVLGEAEITIGNEPAPYGRHLHISALQIHAEADFEILAAGLIDYVKQMASVMKYQQVSVAAPESPEFYRAHGFAPIITRREVTMAAKEGRVFYKAVEMSDFNPNRIDGWSMPLGRYQSARHQWEQIWPGFWNSVPELVEPEVARFEVTLTGQNGILLLEQDRFNPQRAQVSLWSERPLTGHLVSAVRDRAARLHYEELMLLADDTALSLVEPEATDIRDSEMVFAWRVN
jgi:hypothetical protein